VLFIDAKGRDLLVGAEAEVEDLVLGCFFALGAGEWSAADARGFSRLAALPSMLWARLAGDAAAEPAAGPEHAATATSSSLPSAPEKAAV